MPRSAVVSTVEWPDESELAAVCGDRQPARLKDLFSPGQRSGLEAPAKPGPAHRAALELCEAGDGELAKTASGRRQLKRRDALATELRDLHERVARGETSFYEGQRMSQDLRNGFRSKYRAEYLDAYARHVRLQPSVEAVADVLHPDIAAGTAWVSETAYLEALLLQPKHAPPDATSTKSQGIDDPTAFRFCLFPPFPLTEQDPDVVGDTGGAGVKIMATAIPGGSIFVSATAYSELGIGDSEAAQALVGGKVDFPDGVSTYTVSIKFHFDWGTSSWAVFGAAACGADLLIRTRQAVDPEEETTSPFSTSLSPVIWGKGASLSGDATLTLPFRRNASAAGSVRVMVGGSAHAEAYAVVASATAAADMSIHEICIQGTG